MTWAWTKQLLLNSSAKLPIPTWEDLFKWLLSSWNSIPEVRTPKIFKHIGLARSAVSLAPTPCQATLFPSISDNLSDTGHDEDSVHFMQTLANYNSPALIGFWTLFFNLQEVTIEKLDINFNQFRLVLLLMEIKT